MQRFELVADTVEKIDGTIIFAPVAKHWDIDKHKSAMKASEEEMRRVVEMSEHVKTLLHHGYPVTAVTFVQPEQPGEMHICASHSDPEPCVSIQFSPALLGAVADSANDGDTPPPDIESVAREDVQGVFYLIVDYLDAKIVKERDWLDYLCEVVG